MSEQLVLRIPDYDVEVDMTCDWFHFASNGVLKSSGRDTLPVLHEKLADTISHCRITALAPASAFLISSTNIPSRQLKQIKQALPFMVEELIADDIDTVHIAIPEKIVADSQRVDFAVVSHRILIDWLDHLFSHGFSPSKLVIDSLCIPYTENTISVLIENDQLHLRWGEYSALIVTATEIEPLLVSLLNTANQNDSLAVKPQVKVFSPANESDIAEANKLSNDLQQLHPELEIKTVTFDETVPELIASGAASAFVNHLNILQAGYSVKNTNAISKKSWLAAASITAIALTTYLLTALISGWYLNLQADDLEAQSIALYKELFPNERRIISPKKQMQNHLRLGSAKSNAQFLALLSQTARQLVVEEGERKLQLDQLRFESTNGDLQFQVKGSSLDQLDRLKQQLASAGLSVEINSAVEEDDYVKGRIVVRSL
mgnify:CR=1 FL=1